MDDPTPIVDAPRKPPRRFRRTRIAVSVFFGVLTVALCVLWVRSYSNYESVRYTSSNALVILVTWRGDFVLIRHRMGAPRHPIPTWQFGSHAYASDDDMRLGGKPVTGKTVVVARLTNAVMVAVPIWGIFVFACMANVLPWLSLQFSLRTLFIATTLVAVVLGLVCYTIR